LPGHLVNTHIPWGRDGGKLLPGELFEVLPVDPIDDLVIKAEIPPRLLISGDGGKTVYLIGKALGESTPEPVEFLDPDAAIFNSDGLAFWDVQKYSLAAHGQVLDNDYTDAVNGGIVDMTAAGTDGRDKRGLFQQ
jgi:hypothetical protein